MDLAYPSNHDVNVTKKLNYANHVRDSIKLSHKKLPACYQSLSKRQKEKIIHLISEDYAFDLSKYLQKRAIKFETEVGTQGSSWNCLHYAVKCNALECAEYILKEQYKEHPEDYLKLVNEKTIEGHTPLMIAIINESCEVLNLLLELGGLDIHLIDSRKMTAYELAISHQNEFAIKSLMSHSKHCKMISKERLREEVEFTKKEKGCCHQTFMGLISCLTFGMYSNIGPEDGKMLKLNSVSPRRPSAILNMDFFNSERVKIGSAEQEAQFEYEWQDLEEMARISCSNKAYPLFNMFNPFDIAERNVVLKNNVIVLQCLSQHPWLIRKIIQSDKSKAGHFNVSLYSNFHLKRLSVDCEVPYLKGGRGPMFVEDKNQMWPCLLQKALARHYGSYFSLEAVEPVALVQEITGFPTFQVDLEAYENRSIFSLVRELTKKSFYFVLLGKRGSDLCSDPESVDSFSVLSIYDKAGKRYLLINCPFIDQAWKQKEKFESHTLTMIRSHISSQNQMCVWIEMDRIKDYFQGLIVSTILPNYQRRFLKVKARNQIYFTFNVENQREERIVFQLINLDKGTTVERNCFQVKAFSNEGKNRVAFDEGVEGQSYCSDIFSTECQPGDYMCYLDLDPTESKSSSLFEGQNIAESLMASKIANKEESYMVIMWSSDNIEPRHLDENLGPVEFLEWNKFNCVKHWVESELYRVEVVSDYALIIVRDTGCQNMYAELKVDEEDVLEGTRISEEAVELVRQDIDFQTDYLYFYCIVSGAAKYNLAQKSSYIKDKNHADPAGKLSNGQRIIFLSE